MSADPLLRLVAAFGTALVRSRAKRYWTPEALADASGLSPREIRSMEAGDYGPSLLEFFRIAEALGEQPATLLVDVVSALRADPPDVSANWPFQLPTTIRVKLYTYTNFLHYIITREI